MNPARPLYRHLRDRVGAFDSGDVANTSAYAIIAFTFRATVRGYWTPRQGGLFLAVTGFGLLLAHAATSPSAPGPTRDRLRDYLPQPMSDSNPQDAAFADENNPITTGEENPDPEEKPDPSEVAALDKSKHIYQRDEDGELIPEQDVVRLDGEWQRVSHKPPTRGFLQRIESQFGGRDEMDMGEMDGLLAEFYIEPELDADELGDASSDFYLTLMWHMIESVQGGTDSEIMDELEDAVEERQSAQEGN